MNFYYTACSLLGIAKHSYSKLHFQEVEIEFPFHVRIDSNWIWSGLQGTICADTTSASPMYTCREGDQWPKGPAALRRSHPAARPKSEEARPQVCTGHVLFVYELAAVPPATRPCTPLI